MTGVIEAKVFKPVTEPFLEEEIRMMSTHKAEEARLYDTQKAISEEMIAEFKADSDLDIKNQILSLHQHFDLYPILIKLNNTTLNRTFIVDHMIDINDSRAIHERVFCAEHEMARKVQASMDEKLERHRQELRAALEKYGWSMGLFVDAITGGRRIAVNEELTYEEIEENLKEQLPRERAILLDILNKNKGWAPRIYAEIASEFGIPVESFRSDDRLNPIYHAYVIESRAPERDAQKLDIDTVQHLFLEERGRLLGTVRAYKRVDSQSWLARFHPEMTSGHMRMESNW